MTDMSKKARAGQREDIARIVWNGFAARMGGDFDGAKGTVGYEHCCTIADAILSLPAAQGEGWVPGGWQLVPKEPTEGMLNKGAYPQVHSTRKNLWRAMLSAAPPAPAPEGEWRGLLPRIIAHLEDGEGHNEGAFDESCDTCLLLRDLRALLPAPPVAE